MDCQHPSTTGNGRPQSMLYVPKAAKNLPQTACAQERELRDIFTKKLSIRFDSSLIELIMFNGLTTALEQMREIRTALQSQSILSFDFAAQEPRRRTCSHSREFRNLCDAPERTKNLLTDLTNRWSLCSGSVYETSGSHHSPPYLHLGQKLVSQCLAHARAGLRQAPRCNTAA